MNQLRRRQIIGEPKGSPIPRDGLIAEYLFEDNLNDTSGNNINGIGTNITYYPNFYSGLGKDVYFSGSTSYFITDNDYSTTKSVSFWFCPQQANGPCLMALGHTSNHYAVFSVWYTSSKTIEFNFAGFATRVYSPTLDINNWYHIVITNSSLTSNVSNVKLYVNGAQVSITSTTTSTSYTTGTGRSAFAGFFNNRNYPERLFLRGYLDNIRLYNKILTADEVTQLYNEKG